MKIFFRRQAKSLMRKDLFNCGDLNEQNLKIFILFRLMQNSSIHIDDLKLKILNQLTRTLSSFSDSC